MSLQMQGTSITPEARDWRLGVKRGLFGKCPNCGKGRLFRAFLKPVDACESCGEELHHQRADDLPPYITITVVGHVIVGGVVMTEKYGEWPTWLQMTIWPALTVILSLLIMQPIKGAVIGLQWGNRMHGFGGEPDGPTPELKAAPATGSNP
jgi:uncharacterized protein (DUF983 family)